MIDGPPQPTDRYYLSDEDAYLVSKLLNDAGMRVHNPNPAARYYPLPQHNEVSAVAVVKTPLAGIPAMWPMCGTGTGTGSEAAADAAEVIGTGTGSQIYGGERPGFATCELVYLNGVTPSGRPLNRPRLYRIGSGDPVVWNPSFDAIPGNVYLVVVRDSFGAWWPITVKQTSTSGGGGDDGAWDIDDWTIGAPVSISAGSSSTQSNVLLLNADTYGSGLYQIIGQIRLIGATSTAYYGTITITETTGNTNGFLATVPAIQFCAGAYPLVNITIPVCWTFRAISGNFAWDLGVGIEGANAQMTAGSISGHSGTQLLLHKIAKITS